MQPNHLAALPSIVDDLIAELEAHPGVRVTEQEAGRWVCWTDLDEQDGGGELRLDLDLPGEDPVLDAHPATADGRSVTLTDGALWLRASMGERDEVMDLPLEGFAAALRASRGHLCWHLLFCEAPAVEDWAALVLLQRRLGALFPDDDLAALRSTAWSERNWALALRLGALEGWDELAFAIACPKALVLPLDQSPWAELEAVRQMPHLADSALVVVQQVHQPLTGWDELEERKHDPVLAEVLVDASMPLVDAMLDDWSLMQRLINPGTPSYEYTVRLFDLPLARLDEALRRWGIEPVYLDGR